MVRDAAHRLPGAVRQGQAEKRRRLAGVVHEKLVEVAEAEEQKRVGIHLPLHGPILLEHRSKPFLCHGDSALRSRNYPFAPDP